MYLKYNQLQFDSNLEYDTKLLSILFLHYPLQGEEIGMTDVYISWENTVDPQACRTNPDVFHQYSRDPGKFHNIGLDWILFEKF